MRKKSKKTFVGSKKRCAMLLAVVALAAILCVVACSLDWDGLFPAGEIVETVDDPPKYGTLTEGTKGSGERIGTVPAGYNNTTGTAIDNNNKNRVLRTATSGNYYLTEDITGYNFNNLLSSGDNPTLFTGTLDGNGHSITITAGQYTHRKIAGGIFGGIGNGSSSGTVKNLTVIYAGSVNSPKTVLNDGNWFGVGLLAGNFQNGTIENVRVVVNSGVTVSADYSGGWNAIGGMIGHLGGQSAGSMQTFNRCEVEINGTIQVSGSTFIAAGGLVGHIGGTWVGNVDMRVNNFILSGSGKMSTTGSGKRVGGVVGGYRGTSSMKLAVNGFIYDMTSANAFDNPDRAAWGVVQHFNADAAVYSQSYAVNYAKTSRAVNPTVGGRWYEYGTPVQKGTVNVSPALRGITVDYFTYDAEGYLALMLTSTRTDYADFVGVVNSTQVCIVNNWQNYTKVFARIAPFSSLSAGCTAALTAGTPQNVSTVTELYNALKIGRSVSLQGNIDAGAKAFEVNYDYKGMILGNSRSITFTGVSGSAQSDVKQGGLIKTLNNARVENLNVVYSGNITRTLNSANRIYAGMLAGEVTGGTSLENVRVKIAGGAVNVKNTGGEIATGGFFGQGTGAVTMQTCALEIAAGQKLIGGSADSRWTWTGGVFGTLSNPAGAPITMHKIAVVGGGTIEGQASALSVAGGGNNNKRVAGLIGGMFGASAGNITVEDYVFANLVAGNNKSRIVCFDGGTNPITVTRMYYLESDDTDSSNQGNSAVGTVNVSNRTQILKNAYDNAGREMAAAPITVGIDSGFTKLRLTVPLVDYDAAYIYSYQLKNSGGMILSTAALSKNTPSYTLDAPLEESVTLKIQMKQSRSIALPQDANAYEHGYVASGYVQQQGYDGNNNWVEISTVKNTSALGNLSGGGNYWLSSDVEIAGFESTNAFSGVLDGCGHTITIVADAGGNGKNASLGGLFAELLGTVKNVRIVVNTDVTRTSSVNNIGLLAGRADAGAKIYNTKVSLGTDKKIEISDGGTVAMTVGGLIGLSQGSNETPVVLSGVTMEMNGEIKANGKWSWVGGVVGRVGGTGAEGAAVSRKLQARQVIFRGEVGTINNVDANSGSTERTAGFVGALGGFNTAASCTVEADGFIYGFYGRTIGDAVAMGVFEDAAEGKASARFQNVFRVTGVDPAMSSWFGGDFAAGNATVTNDSVVNSAFIQSGYADISLGYTAALFDPQRINTTDGTADATNALIILSIFEDNEKLNELFVADIEILYGGESRTSTEAVALVNVFKLSPTGALGTIVVQIRSGSANDGNASIVGDRYGAYNPTYTAGWLTDNGRVPPMYGIPKGATAINDAAALGNWLNGRASDGTLLALGSTAYLYGYLSQNVSLGAAEWVDYPLAAGRTLDGAGWTMVVHTSPSFGLAINQTGWITGADTAAKSAKLYGELVSKNDGTIKNLTVEIKNERTKELDSGEGCALVMGGFVGVNNGLIENVKLINAATIGPRKGTGAGALIFGGVAGVNRGTIRYATVQNDGTIDLDTTAANQKIAGGIVGVNDGGTIEYTISSGTGIYQIGNSTKWPLLGGVVGLANVSANRPSATGVENVYAQGVTLVPARGVFRYALHNFTGTFKTISGFPASARAIVGALAGSLMPWYSNYSIDAAHAAVGLHAAVANANGNVNSWGFYQVPFGFTGSATIGLTSLVGTTTRSANNDLGVFGGNAINVTYNGTGNSVANDNEHHFWWDYWGGSGQLRYEVYHAAKVSQMTASGAGSSVNADRGTAYFDNKNTNTGGLIASSVTTTFYNGGTYTDYLNGIKNIGSSPASSGGGTDLATVGVLNGTNVRLTGGGNYYLSQDVTVDVSNKLGQGTTAFSGVFDGRGHTITITGAGLNDGTEGYHFGFLMDSCSGTFKNVNIVYRATNMKVWYSKNDRNGRYYAGIVCGDFYGTMENVTFTMAAGSKFWFEGNSSINVWINTQWTYSYNGMLCGRNGGGTIRNVKVNLEGGTLDSQVGQGGCGSVGYNLGIIGWSEGATIENILITGNATFHATYLRDAGVERNGGLLVGRQTNTTIRNVYLENVNVSFTGDKNFAGYLVGWKESGTRSNVYRIGSNLISGTAPTDGVVAGSFFGNTIDDMLQTLAAVQNVSSTVSNGVGSTDPSAGVRDFFMSFAEFKKSTFEAGYRFVTRYPELGYYLEELKSGGKVLSTGSGETTYAIGTIATDSKFPTLATLGVRGKINLIRNTTDALGNVVPVVSDTNTYTGAYNGSEKTAFEFRPTFWGDGTAGAGSVAPLCWNAGGAVVSGRIPLYVNDVNAPYDVQIDLKDANYAFQNAAGLVSIPIGAVQFGGVMHYMVTRAQIEVTSDTGGTGQWKSRGLLTVRLSDVADAVDGAIDQLVYTTDNGQNWQNVLKCDNFADGSATATVNFESHKGGTTFRFRAYSGIYIVSDDSADVVVRVDKSYPNVAWEQNSTPLSTESTERTLVVDDVSVGDLTKADGVLVITGPEGQNLDYTLASDFATSGKIIVSTPDAGAAKTGDYVFTVKDAMGYATQLRERLDFTRPTMTATVTTSDNGGGVTAVTDPETTVGLNLTDNYTDVQSILNTLKVYVYRNGDRSAALDTPLSVAGGTIDTTGFNVSTGLGNVILKLPEKYFSGTVDLVFEAKDAAGNAARVDALTNVILDTREYTVEVERYKTEAAPYATGGLSYRLNGASYTAAPGAEGSGVLHTIRAHLFDALTVVYQKKDGYTYGGFDVTLSGAVAATCPDGTNYVVGGEVGDRGDDVLRRIAFRATEEVKLSVTTTATGAGALRSGSYSDTLQDYFETNADTGAVTPAIPNLINPNAQVLCWNAGTSDYTAVKAWELSAYFDFELTDPNGNAVGRVDVTANTTDLTYTIEQNPNGAYLTFAENPKDPGHFIEGAYTLTLRLKDAYAGIYTLLEGGTATYNVSAKSRRDITISYTGGTEFAYRGTVNILNADGVIDPAAFGTLGFDFAPDAFADDSKTNADDNNLTALRAGAARLNYTLYYNGQLRGSKIGDTVTGDFSICDVGAYYMTVSIPITGTGKFTGVTGTKEIVFTVLKKRVTVTADDQSVLYGDGIAPDAFVFEGIESADLNASYSSGAVLIGHLNQDVLVSRPRLLTEYTLVRIVGGAVSAYENGISLSGGIAKNYDFTLVAGDITILKRGIVLKIEDATKVYGYADPSFEFWGLSASSNSGGVTNHGFAYSDNYLSFTPSEFRREPGENAYLSASGAQISYPITGVLFNQNYDAAVEPGAFTIARRALSFRINGDSGLVFEEGVKRSITAKISNGLTSDNLSVKVEYGTTDWTSIGTHQYRLVVAENGTPDSDQLLRNYSYDTGWIDVVIGASILNVVVLPQVLIYGEEPAQGTDRYVLEGIKAEDVEKVTVRLFLPPEYQTVGNYAGAIGAEVAFATGSNVQYTPAVRKGNLTVLPKEVDLRWSGNFNAVYTGQALDKKITAKVASQTTDSLNVRLSFASKDGVSSSPVGAGSYAVTASLQGTNAENYLVRAEDRARQFVVQKSEQRISVGSNHTYDPESSTYPTFETRYAYRKNYTDGSNTFVVWRARIVFSDLLSVLINTETGYKSTDTRVPSITVHSVESVSSLGIATNALQTFAPTDGSGYFDLEAGTYNAKATLPENDDFTGNTYLFTFVVTETNNKLGTTSLGGNKLDIKNISGSYTATSLGQEVRITDSAKIGYVVGPNAVNRPVSIQNGSISRLMTTTLSNQGHMYDDIMADGWRGTHDGDWAYAYFNIAVSEEIRQLILQDKVEMKLSFTASNQKGGVDWWTNRWNNWWWKLNSDNGAWREDKINPTDLSYMVREVSSANDLTVDPVDASMIGNNGAPYTIRQDMSDYGATEGLGPVGGGLKQVVNGQNLPYYFAMGGGGQEGPMLEQCYETNCVQVKTVQHSFAGDAAETVSLGGVKSGAAFRVYFLSTTLGATRNNVQIRGQGEVAWDGNYVGNVRNSFVFENISVRFVEKNSSVSGDTVAPEVVASPQIDSLTGGTKYRFTVRDPGTGIDFSSISATVNGERLTPGNGLNLSSYETTGDNSQIMRVAHFETGFISGAPELGLFTAKDYAQNTYSAIPSIDRDTVSPTLSGVTLTDLNTGDNVVADEKFWYNRMLCLSVEATDIGGTISNYGIYFYDGNGRKREVLSNYVGSRITSTEALGTGLYYVFATDTAGNTTTVTFNLLVDNSAENGVGGADLAIIPDPNVSAGGGDMWLNGNVAIQNSVNKYGPSYGRMYYATAPAGTEEDETRFRNSYQDDKTLQWFAMDAEVVNGEFVLSENITTATKKYYAFKYVAGAASAPGANDNKTAYHYFGLIQIDRDEPSIVAESFTYLVPEPSDPTSWTEKAGISSGEWTNKTIVFELSGTVGLSKGAIEWTRNGIDAEDSSWNKPIDTGYGVYYFNYVTNRYTQTFDETQCFKATASASIFEYKAYLVVRGPDIGNTYAFRFRNGANTVAEAQLNVTEDHSSAGFRSAIDTTAPEVSHINSSWQPNQTKSQIYINESESGVRSVKVVKQQTDVDGNGVFLNGQPVYEDDATAKDAEFTNNRYYFTFSGVYYKITVTDTAGNVGTKEVKLKIDERNPDVTLDGGAPVYSNRYVAAGTTADREKLGEGVYAYRDAGGNACIEFHFTVKGGISGYTFAYSKVGYSTIESDWNKPGGNFDVGERGDNEAGYTNSFVFRLDGDRAEQYLFRFTSGAQKSVYFNFATGAAKSYRSADADQFNYRVNIDATPATADAFEYNLGDAQWRPLNDYDDTAWVTATGELSGVGIRFTAAENTAANAAAQASTGLGRVTLQEEGGEETEIAPESGYYVFYLKRSKKYVVRVYDMAGNVSVYEIPAKKIDLTAPEITVTATTAGGETYASGQAANSSVTLAYALRYGDSGIVSILFEKGGVTTSYTEDALRAGLFFEADFIGTVRLTIRNGAGVTRVSEFDICIDKTAPDVEITGLPQAYTTDPVDVTVTPVDPRGSGIRSASMTYFGDNGEVSVDVSAGHTFTVRDWREYTVTVTDNAGNTSVKKFSAQVNATVPEQFSMTATVGGAPYVSGQWSAASVVLTFTTKFASVGGVIDYGAFEYSLDGGAWQTLFRAADCVAPDDPNKFVFTFGGEVDGRYAFRAVTGAGNPSADTATIESLKIDTVSPSLTAEGRISGDGGALFTPDTEKGYTWISANVEVSFGYTLGISGGKLYVDYKALTGDAYVRTAISENLVKDGAGALRFTVSEEGYYRFGLNANADLSDAAASVVDFGKIRIDSVIPSVSVSPKQRAAGSELKNYTLATWTKESVLLVVETIVGKSLADSKLLWSKGDAAMEYVPFAGYDTQGATDLGNGTYRIVTTVEISENTASNYDFRIVSGAGTFADAEVRRSGGAVRIDKSAPKLTIESVRAGSDDYATFDGSVWTTAGWINRNLTFTFLVRTYLSGGSLKYYYDGLAGYTTENIASYGSASSGEDENGAYSERRYTLTLAGENFATDAILRFRVESGAGAFSNAEDAGAARVPVQIDKTRPTVDENSVTKTPVVQGNAFTKEEVTIRFRTLDPQVGGIASGVASVEFGTMSGSVFVRSGAALTEDAEGYYTVAVRNHQDYLVRVTDFAGNVSDRAVKENVDRVEPSIVVETGYTKGSLSTSPIAFAFGKSVYGVSGAKAQYRLGADGAWIDAADVGAAFEFRETLFTGTLFFRLVSGSGIESAPWSIAVDQDLNDYRVTVSEEVVASGSYAASVIYEKNGTASSSAPLMKKGERLTVTIVEKPEYPLYKVFVGGVEVSVTKNGDRYSFAVVVSGDTEVKLRFREIVSVAFDQDKSAQSIRVVNGVNTPVLQPFTLSRENRPGFEYTVLYRRIADAYGNAVADGETYASVPQTLGVYRLKFTVTGEFTQYYSFAEGTDSAELRVYYFDKIQTANVAYYAIETAYDLAYIRYALTDGVEFRQTRDLYATPSAVTAEGSNRTPGDWTVGDFTEGVYNGANFKITLQKLDGAGTPLFGAVASGATIKNIGFVAENPRLTVGTGGVWAPFAASVAGLVQNVYASGAVRIAGENVSVGGLVGAVAAGGAVKDSYAGLAVDLIEVAVDLIEVAGDEVRAGGVAVENAGAIEKVFSVGSVTGTERLRSGDMLAVNGSGSFAGAVTIDSAIYAGTEVLKRVYPADSGVTVVKYWDLNDRTKNYWDTAILSETVSPKADQVSLKDLIDKALNGLTFETDENNNRYVPIANFDSLEMVDKYLWADFRQTADIDSGGQPIAIAKNAPFTGSFNGNGFVIENVSVGAGDGVENGYGLFGNVTGTIENVVLKEFTFNARNIGASDVAVGGLVRNLVGGTVRNVSVGGTILAGVPGGTLTVGGAVGKATGGAEIDRVLSTVSVTTDGRTKLLYAGSIVGAVASSSVRNVYSIAKVDANYEKRAAVGQLIGLVNRGDGAAAEAGYAVMGVTYRNGQGGDSVIGYDEAGVANALSFKFATFDEMMDAARHPDYTVNGRHISETLKTLFPFEKGTGVQSDPFEIRTAEEFLLIGNYLYAHYNVVSDIEFTGNFETIGKGMFFTGSIKGMNRGDESVKKLTGVTDALVDKNRGTIQGLEIQSNVVKSVAESAIFGAVANVNYGTISFVKANGAIALEGSGAAGLTVGGIAGRNEGRINNSNANFTTALGAADLRFGGIAGVSVGGALYENVVQGTVAATALGASVGMFAGTLNGTTVTRLTDSSGANVDVFLSITINGAAVSADMLSGFVV